MNYLRYRLVARTYTVFLYNYAWTTPGVSFLCHTQTDTVGSSRRPIPFPAFLKRKIHIQRAPLNSGRPLFFLYTQDTNFLYFFPCYFQLICLFRNGGNPKNASRFFIFFFNNCIENALFFKAYFQSVFIICILKNLIYNVAWQLLPQSMYSI